MPSQFHPKQSGRHRIACFALYRALLEQCLRIPIPPELHPQGPVNPLKYLIRRQFRRNANEQSPRIIVAALETGYATEKFLRAAGDGDLDSTSKIHEFLQDRLNKAAASFQIPQPPKPEIRYPEAFPRTRKLLDKRPLPLESLSGRRHVPRFEHSSSVTFLRVQKPQSPYLSRVIRDKIEQKHTRTDSRERIQELLSLAEYEDNWEALVEEQLEEEGLSVDEWNARQPGLDWGSQRWGRDMAVAESEINYMMKREQYRVSVLSQKQLDLIDKETELWRKERSQRRHEKKEAKKARKERERTGSSLP